MKETAERISLLYEKILDNQDWEIQDLDELLDLSRKDGIEWQAKQSSWISVEERLPAANELVLCRMASNEAIVSGYIFISPDNLPCVSTLPDFEFEDYGGYVCDRWMPIPE